MGYFIVLFSIYFDSYGKVLEHEAGVGVVRSRRGLNVSSKCRVKVECGSVGCRRDSVDAELRIAIERPSFPVLVDRVHAYAAARVRAFQRGEDGWFT